MELSSEQLQRKVEAVEFAAEELLIARRQLVESDKSRNGTREALTALRRQARTSKSSVLSSESDEKICRTCGDSDGSRPVWSLCPGADVFVRLPFHQVHCNLERAQVELETDVNRLQSTVKEKTFLLSEKGAIADVVSPSLVESFVKLKDRH
ncbi:uncharacterized protein LOC9629071 isoform X3 [Selaginella moellendorffii]|uniref:uncharacterized protein LOC9629071 isoform X3 n=1 Tax=Selaginella moellendorffii TaxID=88036 RepID=UPI000D1CAE7B|nr:uncharacterized protein LOC9629071 isoform X3 [Selaginella moellendorffii]|eukprot:XP_002975030.2 uncharacterized protein LOC9629071 isoform X3 [Selaginella moellendorffii]